MPDLQTASAVPDGARPSERREARARVLVVEDDAAMREMLREALDEDGYAVETAAGGRAGIERVKQGGVDLVISDVKMPDLDGLDMLREIKGSAPSRTSSPSRRSDRSTPRSAPSSWAPSTTSPSRSTSIS